MTKKINVEADPFASNDFKDEALFRRGTIAEYPILNVLKPYLEGHNGYIAGGAFKDVLDNKMPRDIDIWFETSEDFNAAVRTFGYGGRDYKSNFANDNAYGYRHELGLNVELIKHQFGYPEDVLESFDFTVAKFALDQHGGIIYHKDYFEHLKAKSLVMEGYAPNPVNTWERTLKYTRYGYKPTLETKGLIIRGIQGIIDLVEDDQLSGDTNNYGQNTEPGVAHY